MAITVDLPPNLENLLRGTAERTSMEAQDYVRRLIERDLLPRVPTARELLAMRPDERGPYLAAAAEALEDDYRSDLARPESERELTAFTALDGEPFHDDESETEAR